MLMTAASLIWSENHARAPADPATDFPVPDPDDPEAFARECPDEFKQCWVAGAMVNLVSPPGSSNNFGTSPEIIVRTVAFGAVPVEAVIQLEQERTADDLPESILLKNSEVVLFRPGTNRSGVSRFLDSSLALELYVRVKKLEIDGRAVRFTGACRTQEPATLNLEGKGFREDNPNATKPYWDSGYFAVATGGLLEGTVDVGAFDGCRTTTGDDLGPLLTASISSSGKAVVHTTGPTGCNPLGLPSATTVPPGTTIDQWRDAGCTIPPAPDLPAANE